MAGKMADLCRFVIATLCGPVPGGVSRRARDVESRTILADYVQCKKRKGDPKAALWG
jgi:hypothetical protein